MTFNRREFLHKCIAGSVALSALPSMAMSRPAGNPRNVLFIAVDDLRTELGCYGVPYAISPNLDRLASEGVLFTNHFAQVPTCGASRYTLLTGRDPCNSGVTRNNRAFYQGDSALSPELGESAQSMPELFRRSGYHTVEIGKISHTADGKVFEYDGQGDGRDEVPNAWDELATPYGPWKRGWGIFFAYSGGRSREDGHGYRDLMEFTVENDEDLPDGMMARCAVEKLRELAAGKQPFFLGVGFFKPHLPFVAPRQDWEAMMKIDVPPPPHPEKPDSLYWNASSEFYNYDMPFPKTRPLAPKDRIMARRAYLACVRYTDRQIGKVLAELEALGLADSTVVVVWGDHGWFLGDSQMWAKHAPQERALRSTLMIRAPGVSRPGTQSDALVASLDLYPTLVDLCKPPFTKTAYPLDGVSLRPILDGTGSRVHEAVVSYWKDAVTVRTDAYRLIARKSGDKLVDAELYDIRESPDPVSNIAESKPKLVKKLLGYIDTRN